MITDRLRKQIEFALEIDKLKNIYRQTYVLRENRKENDAEHSWHIAVLTFLLAEHSATNIDTLKVMKMVLIHDIVEIDAGDTYCYDYEGYKTKADREENAARRIFGLLPKDQAEEMYNLWREFEEKSSEEARFAAVLDRLQPILLNYSKDGISWKEHDVHKKQVEKRTCEIKNSSEIIAELISEILDDAAEKGFLRNEQY